MKKIFLIIGLIISVFGFSQNPTNYQYRFVRERSLAGMFDSGLHFPRYSNTPSGIRVGVSTQSGNVAIDTVNHVGFFYSGEKWRNFGSQGFETRLVYGGQVTWDSLLVFSVAQAYYYINGAYYTSSLTHITLDAANGSNDRIDLLYLDSTGVHKQTGVASATPAEPSLPPNSIRLTAISVPTSATSPGGGIDTVTVYDENIEWIVSTTSLTAPSDDNTLPYHFVKDIQTGALTNASILKFTATSPINAASFTTLRFYVKLKGSFTVNTYLTVYFVLSGVKTCIPIEVKNGTYGFSRNNTTSYQQITIPISDFAFTNSSADGLWIQSSGSNSSGIYMDWIQLQGGITQPTPPAQGVRFGVEDNIASQNRIFSGRNNTYNFTFDSLNQFSVNRAGVTRIYQNSSASGFYSPNSSNQNYVTNSFAGFDIGGLNQFFTFQDSSRTSKRISYTTNINGSLTANSLVTKGYVDSVVAASGGTPGINDVLAVNQALSANRSIPTSAFYIEAISSSATAALIGTNSSSGAGFQGTSNSGYGISGTSTSAYGGFFQSTSGTGLYGESTSGLAGYLYIQPTSTNAAEELLRIDRRVSGGGTAANGIGSYLSFRHQTDDGVTTFANAIVSKFTNADGPSNQVSQLVFQAVHASSTVDALTLGGEGYMKLRNITATQASAITASDGMIVYVTNTNGTFTSVGFWGYENGAWVKL